MLTRLPTLTLLASLAACGASPTASAPAADLTQVDRPELVISGIGESGSVVASARGQSTGTPTLSLVSESRWLSEAPVLDAAALGAGRIVAAAPGQAELDVRAYGAGPARVRVRVEPARPVVMSLVAGDTLVLRGYRMDRLGAVSVGADAATPLGGDSATLRLRMPALQGAACARPAPGILAAHGADVAPGLEVRRRHADEVRLGIGEMVRLDGDRARCLRLAPLDGAAYALAFLDTRAVRRSLTGPEGSAAGSSYTVAIAEAGQSAPALAQVRPYAAATPDRASFSAAAAGSPVARATPWRAGDRFQVSDPAYGGSVPARVVRIYGGHLVLAIAEDQAPAMGTEAFLARTDSAFASTVEHGYPLLRSALSASAPVTSAGSGQLLVVARPASDGTLGSAVTVPVGTERFHYLLLNSGQSVTASGLTRTLAHEVAHAWQERWAATARPAGAVGIGAPAWAVEGNADLFAAAVLRRTLGIGVASNWNWAAGIGDPHRASYALMAASARGEVTAGYASSASFQMDLVGRLMRAGVAEEVAMGEVSRGILEGWHGWDAAGTRHEGLARRMSRRLGGAWDPTGALLTWALSQAADDLTQNPEAQNSVFAGVSTAGEATAQGWLPAVTLHTGAAATRTDVAASATLSGNAASVARRQGSPAFVRIEDGGKAGVYSLAAGAGTASGDLAWALVRIR